MQRAAVFFDRDNTLIRNDGYLADPDQVVLIEGAADAIARLCELGFAIITFSNQSGVVRGMFTEDAVRAVNTRMDEMLRKQNPAAVINAHEFCPYHPNASVEAYRQESDLRKPKPGMITQAAQRLDVDLSRSWVVGDAPRDIEAGRSCGVQDDSVSRSESPPFRSGTAGRHDRTRLCRVIAASRRENNRPRGRVFGAGGSEDTKFVWS